MRQFFSQEAIHLQIQALVGSKVWQSVFAGCIYRVSDGTLVILAPTSLAVTQIIRKYGALLERYFHIPVCSIIKPRRNPVKLSRDAKTTAEGKLLFNVAILGNH